MRARPVLISWTFINLWLGISLVLAPNRLSPAARTVLALTLDYGYGSGFLLAALLCLLGAVVWSRRMQRHLSIRLIRLARIVGLGASLCMMLALLVVEFIIVLVTGGNILTVGFVAGLVAMMAMAINEADLTPVREAYIWHAGKVG